MANLINQEKRLLLMVSYVLVMGFATVGILLISVFNNSIFIDLTFKFLLISAIPILVIYHLDSFYNKISPSESYVQSHLGWIAFHYLVYCIAYLIDYLLISPLLHRLTSASDYFILGIFMWSVWRFGVGFNRALEMKEAPHHYALLIKIRSLINHKK